jgi:demethylmenaquinone methyltransferase/2-methoxy-6-polyprenyl-1,4-benzoquinol methylase
MTSPSAASNSDPASVQRLFSAIATRYDLANHLLSAGMDFFWRKKLASIVAGMRHQTILDLATGSGDIALTLAKHCPDATLFGADFCHPMLLQAAAKGVRNLVTADGLNLPFPDETFDVVTIAFGLRNMKSRLRGLSQMRRVLKPGGHVLVLDFSIPKPPLRGLYRFYLHNILPWVAGIVTGEKEAYQYLGDSIEKFPQGEAMIQKMLGCGYQSAKALPLSFGIVTLYIAQR